MWIAPESIRPGEKWVAAIERGLEESGVFLAVVTPAALVSRCVQMETHAAIDFAVQEVLRLLPLRLQPCTVPALLRATSGWISRADMKPGATR